MEITVFVQYCMLCQWGYYTKTIISYILFLPWHSNIEILPGILMILLLWFCSSNLMNVVVFLHFLCLWCGCSSFPMLMNFAEG